MERKWRKKLVNPFVGATRHEKESLILWHFQHRKVSQQEFSFFFKGFFFFIKKYPTAKITFVFTVKSRQNYWNANGIGDDNDVAIRKNNESTVHDDHESQKRKHYEHTYLAKYPRAMVLIHGGTLPPRKPR